MATPPWAVLPAAPTERAEHLGSLALLLGLLRSGRASTKAELCQHSGLSRSVVTQRVGQLIGLALVAEGGLAPSTGGRAPRELRFRGDAGRVLAISAGATGLAVGLADLNGRLLAERQAPIAIADGPEIVLGEVERLAAGLLEQLDGHSIWGVGVGLPGPIEFSSGRPASPPIMPGWDGYPVRQRLAERFGAPTWVDNDVNIMALGELRAGNARGVDDLVFVKVGTGIGAGLVSRGQLHRGAQGAAGDVGHVAVMDSSPVACRCGNTGCLEALAGGAALLRDAAAAAHHGDSPILAGLERDGGGLTATDLARAVQLGDRVTVTLLERSGALVGEMLATLVSFYNPTLVVLGGSVATSSDLFLAAVRRVVYRRSLSLATRELRIELSSLGHATGTIGAAAMVLDELFTPERLGDWITGGVPVGAPANKER